MPVQAKDQEKFAFVTQFGLWEYRRALMGYKNAPAHFVRCIDILLEEAGIEATNAAFMDDITTFGADFAKYVQNQGGLFEALRG